MKRRERFTGSFAYNIRSLSVALHFDLGAGAELQLTIGYNSLTDSEPI
jgi:hypothetical protein